jgi:hypothetical protein
MSWYAGPKAHGWASTAFTPVRSLRTRGRGGGDWLSFGLILPAPLETSPRKGAETSIFLASDLKLEGVTGKHFSHRRETKSSPESLDLHAARLL